MANMAQQVLQVDRMIGVLDRVRKVINGGGSRQVSNIEQKTTCKVLAMTWFNQTLPALEGAGDFDAVDGLNCHFKLLLEWSDRSVLRAKYKACLAAARRELIGLRSNLLTAAPNENTGECPDFSTLVHDPRMQQILERRWDEVHKCITAGANLSAAVMMGATLEGLLLARINRMADQSPLFKTKSCPKDPKTGKARPWQKWTLNDFINVAFDMKWISRPAKDVSIVLRDYRNFIHPHKELSEGISLSSEDTEILWSVFAGIVKRLIRMK
jgi:hypothetical protein